VAKAYLERAGDAAELVISAPPLNLLDGQMIGGLEAALAEVGALARSGAARAMLLRAEGRLFCAPRSCSSRTARSRPGSEAAPGPGRRRGSRPRAGTPARKPPAPRRPPR
jgi:enoyl-CoA hydratase/carnithine racemase